MTREQIEQKAKEHAIKSMNFKDDESPDNWSCVINTIVEHFIAGAESALLDELLTLIEKDNKNRVYKNRTKRYD